MSARHRMPRRAGRGLGVAATGLAAAATGLVLLVAPDAPVVARAGSVLDAPAVAPAGAQTPADAAAPLTRTSSAPVTVAPPAAPTAAAAPAPAAPAAVPADPGFVPDHVVVEALGVDAPLVTTLVDPDGAFVPPDDPARLGWWRGVRPGAGTGSVVVAGHIDSTRFGQGPLARLVALVPGDRAVLSGADGARAEYVVRGIETFPKDALPASELFGTDGAERLVLVTCGGTFDRARGSWDSNVVAVLDPVAPA